LISTRADLGDTFFRNAIECGCRHFEIETYTFNEFPENLRKKNLIESIAEEYAWVLERL
jgi:hypothetical protein